VSESATTYVSILQTSEKGPDSNDAQAIPPESPTAFSLSRFIPLLKERITVLNPFTRMFLVSWITLLDSIPDLELVSYLPDFLGGLFKFLSDSNQDVHTATQVALEKFLAEIKKIARLKRGLALSKRSQVEETTKLSDSSPARSDRSPRSLAVKMEARKEANLVVGQAVISSQTLSEMMLTERSKKIGSPVKTYKLTMSRSLTFS